MLELHNVQIGQLIRSLSVTIDGGLLVSISGSQGSGKTSLLRAILGFIPVDSGHICIDGELLTPKSAPYFRRKMAYVPQHLTVPEGYNKIDNNYVQLVRKMVEGEKELLIVDEPEHALSEEDQNTVDGLLQEAAQRGATVLVVNSKITQNTIRL